MPQSYSDTTADGATALYSFSFGYIDRTHVGVFVDGIPVGFTFTSDNTLQLDATPAANSVVRIKRTTPNSPLVQYSDGETLTETDLNLVSLQSRYLAEESADTLTATLSEDDTGELDSEGRRVKNLGTPIADSDAATKLYVDSGVDSGVVRAETAATNAEDSAATANTHATNASGAASSSAASALAASQDAEQTAVDANRAETAASAPSGISTRATAAAASIPAILTLIKVASYDGSSMTQGGITYRRSTSTEINTLGLTAETRCWFQSADGAYWLLDALIPTITMFGGYAHPDTASMTHEGAVDSTDAITQGRAYARALSRPLYVDGYFKHLGELIPESFETIVGPGRRLAGVQIWSDSTETGLKIVNDFVTVKGLELQSYLYAPKPSGGGTGMYGNSLIIGNYFDPDGAIPVPFGFYIDDVYTTRKDNEAGYTSYNGIAFQIGGGANQGFVGLVEVGTRHSVAMMSHWNGDGTVKHGAYTSSVHPRYFTVQKLIVSGTQVESILTTSSVASLRIDSVTVEQTRRLFSVLPGDDADNFNTGDPNVGANVYVGQLVCNNIDAQGDPVDDAAVSLASVATSKFALEEGLPKKVQLPMHFEIGELTINTNDPANLVYGIDLFEFYGSFSVRNAVVTGFPYAFRARKSRGNIHVNFDETDGRVLVSDSDAKTTGFSDRNDPSGYDRDAADINLSYNIRAEKDGWPAALAANDITRGDTTITVPAGITEDTVRGSKIEVTGTTSNGVETLEFKLDRFTESGLTVLDLGFEMPHSMTGVTVNYPGLSNLRADMDHCEGSRIGAFLEGCNADLRGISAGRFGVYGKGTDTFAKVEITEPIKALARGQTENYSVYDVYGEDGPVVHLSGLVGAAKVSGIGTYRSLGAQGAPNMTVLLNDAHIMDASKVWDSADEIDLEVGAYTTAAGQVFSNTLAWTPEIQLNGATTGITYTTQYGFAKKVGDFVWLQAEILLSSKGTATGNVWLPVPVNALPDEHTPISVTMDDVAFGANEVPAGYVDGSIIRFLQQSNTVDPSMNDAQLTNVTRIRVTAFYRWR